MSISSINYALFEALSVVFHVSTLKHESVISDLRGVIADSKRVVLSKYEWPLLS